MNETNARSEKGLERKAELAERFAESVPALRMAWRLNDRARLRLAIDRQASLLAEYEALKGRPEPKILARG